MRGRTKGALICGFRAQHKPACHLPCLPTTLALHLQGGAGIRGMGVSLVDALSTLKVMGLNDEFQE